MTNTTQHTPTPWRVTNETAICAEVGGRIGATGGDYYDNGNKDPKGWTFPHGLDTQANAAFIVAACNAHDELVAALRVIESRIDRASDTPDYTWTAAFADIRAYARAALAKVGAK